MFIDLTGIIEEILSALLSQLGENGFKCCHSCRDRKLLFFVKDLILLALKILFEVFLDEKSNQKPTGGRPWMPKKQTRIHNSRLHSLMLFHL